MQKIPEKIMVVVRAIVPLLIIVTLFIVLANIGFAKIAHIQDKVATANKDKTVLTQKLDLLRTVAVNGVRDSNEANNSLPDSNPALAVVYQLRNLAAENGLILTSIKAKIDPNASDGIYTVKINFNVIGGKSFIESFLLNTRTIAPIASLSKVKVTEASETYNGDVTINSYWAALPTQLPETIEGLEELSPEDRATLAIVNGLRQPTFLELPPATDEGKSDPFSP